MTNAGSNDYKISSDNSPDGLIFSTNTADVLTIDSSANVTINDGDLVIGTAGHGIDFSNQTTATGGSPANQAQLLDHFETGTFTPNIVNYDGSQFADFSTNSKGVYTRVGDLICVSVYLQQSSYTEQRVAADAFLTNLPFTPYNSTGSAGQVATGSIQNSNSAYNSGSAGDDLIILAYSSHLSGSFIISYKNGQVVEEGNFQNGGGSSQSVQIYANFSYRSQ